jgi:hypothetical protein
MDRRKHRTPFAAEQAWILSANGEQIAICETPELARFLKVAANNFDALTEALDLCRGEIDLEEIARISPAIARIRALREQVERELRN